MARLLSILAAMKTPGALLGCAFLVLGSISNFALAQNLAGDEALSKVLIDSEGWQLVAEGFGFTDAACADGEGNFYFFALGKGTGIQRIGSDGKVTTFIDKTPKCSGLKFGPDGRLYACTQGTNKQVAALEVPSGNMTVLADEVQPNDLIVSRKGR